MRKLALIFFATLPLLTADSPAKASEAAYRTWTSFTGSSIEAKLVKQNPGNAVTLRKKDGSTLFVDFRQLSPQDRKYLQELAALEGRPERILFIGNSYTGGVRGMLTKLLAASPYKGCHLGFVTPGGRTLKQHLENESTMQKVREGDWHVVVLQDQSQTPAVFPDKFMEAARAIDDIIDDSGAQTVFFETWGRRDGDKMNLHLFPNYETMQEALSESYAKAARKCGAGLAPVGQAWKILRETYPEIGIKLYTGDGSHPSGIGAYLAACVFYATLFDADPTEVDFGGGLPEEQVEAIHAAVLEIME